MATLVSLNDAIYSLAYWMNVATKVADGIPSTDATDLNRFASTTASNLVANESLATVTGYMGSQA